MQKAQNQSGLPVVTPPSMEPAGGKFLGRVIVTIRAAVPGCAVVGTNDGSQPSVQYSGPGHFRGTSPFKMTLMKSTELKFLVVTPEGRYSAVATHNFEIDSASKHAPKAGRAGSMPDETDSAKSRCSVGILFEKCGSGIQVHRLLPGSAADLDGRIQKGDLVISVDGRPTSGMGVAEVQRLVSGAADTQVSIIFQRAGTPLGSGSVIIEAALARAPQAGPFALEGTQV